MAARLIIILTTTLYKLFILYYSKKVRGCVWWSVSKSELYHRQVDFRVVFTQEKERNGIKVKQDFFV